MAGTKEIRSQIGSVKNTQKITSAMELVAASKMRKAQERLQAGNPYALRLHQVVDHLANANPEYRHHYMGERKVERVGYIIIATDRGLCGGLNINLFKIAIESIQEWHTQGVDSDLCLIGSKAASFFRNLGSHISACLTNLGDEPALGELIGGVKVMLDAFNNNNIQRLYILHNEFINTMSQRPKLERLLPLVVNKDSHLRHHWDYLYEPDARELLNELLKRYIETQVYHGVIENNACEQASRMIAMKSATDNAGELINDLQLVYNKARQAAITQEISEIVGGAAAV
jgi:F-type H+-transporting ATPase subunit gamma